LEDEVFEMIQGGLSSFKADARGAALSLKPLMETAMNSVPASLRGCTPIAVKATAGLRLLGAEMSHKILKAVRDMLEQEYPFPIADGREKGKQKGVEIMEGRDEGVFAWITVNYLLNRIGSDGSSSEKEQSLSRRQQSWI
jgi:guanosine-diphosphatase